MDHFTLTLILGSIEIIIIPWAVWTTRKNFDLEKKVAVLESEVNQETKMQRQQNSELKASIEKMDKELDDIRKEINAGFKDILNEMRK